MLDASQAIALPMGLTTADLADPNALMGDLPLVAATPAPSSPVQADASLPASVSDVADLPATPSTASLSSPATSDSTPVIRPMTLAAPPTLSAAVESFDASSGSDSGDSSSGGSDYGSDSGSGSGTGYGSDSGSGYGSDSGSGSGYGSDSSSGTGDGSGSGSGSDSSSGSGGDSSFDPTVPINSSQTITDDAGDSKTLTVVYTPNPDGTFTFVLSLSYSYGTPPAPGTPIADDATNSNGGSGSFTFSITAGLNSVTIAVDGNDSDSYNIDDALTGATSAGTFTGFGHDSDYYHDSITLNGDGTASGTDSSGASSTDKYNFSFGGTAANGDNFSYSDVGNDSSSYDDSENDESVGSGSDTSDEDDTSTETITLGETGGGLNLNNTSRDTVGYVEEDVPVANTPGASTDTVTTTDVGSDSSTYQDSGSINGASFTVNDQNSDKRDDSDVVTTSAVGGASTLTETTISDGSDTYTDMTALSGVDDSSGYGYGYGSGSGSGSDSGSGSSPSAASDSWTDTDSGGGTSHTTMVNAPNPGGEPITEEVDETDYGSQSQSGTYLGSPFSESSSGSGTGTDTAEWGGVGGFMMVSGPTTTSTPPNQTQTGSLPEDGGPTPLSDDMSTINGTAGYGVTAAASDVAAALVTVTVSLVQAPGQAQQPGATAPPQNPNGPVPNPYGPGGLSGSGTRGGNAGARFDGGNFATGGGGISTTTTTGKPVRIRRWHPPLALPEPPADGGGDQVEQLNYTVDGGMVFLGRTLGGKGTVRFIGIGGQFGFASGVGYLDQNGGFTGYFNAQSNQD